MYSHTYMHRHTHLYKHALTMSLDSKVNMIINTPTGPQEEARLFLCCKSLDDWLVLRMSQINAKMSQPGAAHGINSKTTLEH